MTSFSPSFKQVEDRRKLRAWLRKELPWIPKSALSAKNPEAFRDEVGRVLNATVPEIDLLIVDEAHNLKHGLRSAVARGEDRTPIGDLDRDLFQRVVDVKLRGTFLCTQAVVQRLYAQNEGGKIVNVASIAGKRGSANTLAYNAANFGMVGMTQSMAHEFGPHGINVNCV